MNVTTTRAGSVFVACLLFACAKAPEVQKTAAFQHTQTPLGPLANADSAKWKTLTTTQRLVLARLALEQTLAALAPRPDRPKNRLDVLGNRRMEARATVQNALEEVAAAQSYVRTHPEADIAAPRASLPEDPPIRLAGLPPALDPNPAGRFTNPEMVNALNALNDSLNSLTNARPGVPAGGAQSSLDDLAGSRVKIMRDISQAETEINAGMNASYDSYVQERVASGDTMAD
jgi:hypothetical protein